MNWTTEHKKAFENLKQKITEIPCLAQYNSDYPNIFTTDASTKGLGATLWQEQLDGKLKPIGFASRFLSDTEKKYAIDELEVLAVVWGFRTLPPIYLRKTYKVTHRSPSTRAFK